MNSNKLFLLLALVPSSALAANPTITCVSAADLDRGTEECKHNPHYTQAGQGCLKNLESLIQGMTKLSVAQLRQNAEAARESQSGKLQGSEKGYDLSGKNVDLILAAAKIAKASVGEYRDNIYYPEDWDAPDEIIGNGEDFLNSQPCYADARDSLEEIEDTIDDYIAQFEKTKSTLDVLEAATGTRKDSLTEGGAPTAPVVNKNVKAPKAPSSKQTRDWKASDISGTEEKPKE